jgi:hypothetical protein
MRTVNSWSLEWNWNGTGMELEWNWNGTGKRHRLSSLLSKRPKPSDKDCSVGENKGQSGMPRCCSVLCMYSSMQRRDRGRWSQLLDGDFLRTRRGKARRLSQRALRDVHRQVRDGMFAEGLRQRQRQRQRMHYCTHLVSGIWYRLLSAVYHDMAAWPVCVQSPDVAISC